jgi:hypothetical protein
LKELKISPIIDYVVKPSKGTSINDVPCFWPFLTYLLTYLVLLYNVPFWGLSWTPLPTLISNVINGRSPITNPVFAQQWFNVKCVTTTTFFVIFAIFFPNPIYLCWLLHS